LARGSPLARAIRKSLRGLADPAKAPFMQAYMKSEMPYYGVMAPVLRKASKEAIAAHPLASFESWRDTILELWRDARYREERYGAIELARYSKYRTFRALPALPMFEEMIVTGAWWDYVDVIASHLLGELLRKQPVKMAAILREWAVSDNLWKRRSSIIAQLRFKAETDLELLADCIHPSIGEREFFLRKAIGWALREYSKTDPRYVIRFVRQHETRLSPLSKREALRLTV
jgi:3-methyladenine DNA glycosylase AlkD